MRYPVFVTFEDGSVAEQLSPELLVEPRVLDALSWLRFKEHAVLASTVHDGRAVHYRHVSPGCWVREDVSRG